MHLGRAGTLSRQEHAVGHFLKRAVRNRGDKRDHIFFFMIKRRVGKPVMKGPVVGQQQQPRGILVQASDRVNPLRNIHQIRNQFFARLLAARDISPGLVERDIEQALPGQNRFSVDFNRSRPRDQSGFPVP